MATVNVATKATTTKAPTVSEGTSIKIGHKTHTIRDLIGQVKAEYETLFLLNEQMLEKFKYIGETFISIRSLFASDKLFGQFVAGTDLSVISRQDRSDAVFVAKNWADIVKMNKNGTLDGLGVSAIRKRIVADRKEQSNPKNKASAGNVSKGKAKVEQTIKTDQPQFENVKSLAAFVEKTCAENGWGIAAFAKELAALRSKK